MHGVNRWCVAAACAVLAVASSACGDRLERRQVDGVDCVVVSNGVGRAQHVDCNWDDAGPAPTDKPG